MLGSKVRDKVTGFEGLAEFRVVHMNDCIRYMVQPVIEDGQLPESAMCDGPNLEVIAPPSNDLPPAVNTLDAIKLGAKVKDILTGYEGIAILRIKHMYSGDRYGVQGPMDKNTRKVPDIKTFDENDLEQIDPPVKKKKGKDPPQGPHDRHTIIGR